MKRGSSKDCDIRRVQVQESESGELIFLTEYLVGDIQEANICCAVIIAATESLISHRPDDSD